MKRFIVGMLVTMAVVQAVLIVVFRKRTSGAMTALRKFNRDVVNPRMLRTAGSDRSEFAVIHHVGRSTGRSLHTPVYAVPTANGFVVPLPFGAGVDWVRNVLAAKGTTLEIGGHAYVVIEPRIVTADSAEVLSATGASWSDRAFGVTEYLQVDRLDSVPLDGTMTVDVA